jgi:hypothetical protein
MRPRQHLVHAQQVGHHGVTIPSTACSARGQQRATCPAPAPAAASPAPCPASSCACTPACDLICAKGHLSPSPSHSCSPSRSHCPSPSQTFMQLPAQPVSLHHTHVKQPSSRQDCPVRMCCVMAQLHHGNHTGHRPSGRTRTHPHRPVQPDHPRAVSTGAVAQGAPARGSEPCLTAIA